MTEDAQRLELSAFLDHLSGAPGRDLLVRALRENRAVYKVLEGFWNERPNLRRVVPDLLDAYGVIEAAFRAGHKLFLCGNGGSFADALHISGELMKSYLLPRPLPPEHYKAIREAGGDDLASSLQRGFPVIVLGLNHSLLSALENDVEEPRLGFAQELYCLGGPGDVLLGISTSGKAVNVRRAAAVAIALGMQTIALTGEDGGPLARQVALAIRVPARNTREVQELHQPVYHALCAMLEASFFGRASG